MDLSRRSFMQGAGALTATSVLPEIGYSAIFEELGAGDIPYESRLPILQGPTDHNSATIIILAPVSMPITPIVHDPQGRAQRVVVVERWALPGSHFSTIEIKVQGLSLGVDYTLYLVNDRGRYVDRRTFKALDINKRQSRIAVVSCMNDMWKKQAVSMWNGLAQDKCDAVIFLGDTCYADVGNRNPNEVGLASRYAETRSTLSWFRQLRLTPSFATWDDHDYGSNNADRRFRYAPFTRLMFRKFWGSQPNSTWRLGHGVGSVLEAFGQRFYLLDGRSFRDPSGTKGGSFFGSKQTDWLLNDLARSKKPSWLMSGSQFFGGYLGKESFEGDHNGDMQSLLQRVSRLDSPVCFASGDVHFSEVMKIEPELLGYPTYEFTSSSMHSFTLPGGDKRAKNPRRVASEWRYNYMLFDVNMNSGWRIEPHCRIGGARAMNQSRELQVSRG